MEPTIETLSENEILTILRASDEIIAQGGRTLLAKILKGSREKRVLQLELDKSPSYGYFKSEKLDTVMAKIDWMLDHDFLDLEYDGRLPMIVFTDRGWCIERDQLTDEFLAEWDKGIKEGSPIPDMSYLRDRNRNMILLLIQKAQESGKKAYIPYLEAWEKVDYRKVRAAIREAVQALENGELSGRDDIQQQEKIVNEALKGVKSQDVRLRCIDCGKQFIFLLVNNTFSIKKVSMIQNDVKNAELNVGYWDRITIT